MYFNSTLATYAETLKRVHRMYIDHMQAPDGDEALDVQQSRVLASMLLVRNVPLWQLVGSYESVVTKLADYLRNPKEYGNAGRLPNLSFVHTVSMFKTDVIDLHGAVKFGILGILSGLFNESIYFVAPSDDDTASNRTGKFYDWAVPDRLHMRWAVPNLSKRAVKIDDPSAPAGYFASDIVDSLADTDLGADADYQVDMIYRNAVRRIYRTAAMCPTQGYGISLICGNEVPSAYYETSDEDFLPIDMVDKMNTVLYYDPPTGYLQCGDKVRSYHGVTRRIPPLSALCDASVIPYASLPAATIHQLECVDIEGDLSSNTRGWACYWVPRERKTPRHSIRLAVDFSLQHLFHQTGALTEGARGHRMWYKYYIDLRKSYSDLGSDAQACKGIVTEHGAFMAYLTRFTVTRESEDAEPSTAEYTLFADRGFLSRELADSGDVTFDAGDHQYNIHAEYVSSWTPSGPGLCEEDSDLASEATSENTAYSAALGTAERESPFAAYKVIIKMEDHE